MSYIDHLRLKVKIQHGAAITRRAHLFRQLSSSEFEVRWLSPSNFLGTLSKRDWVPEKLTIVFQGSARRRYYFFDGAGSGWDIIETLLRKKIRHEAVQPFAWKGRAQTKPKSPEVKTETKSKRSSGKDKLGDYRWVRGERAYHEAAEEIIDTYGSFQKAVLILPDSWLDEQLQKMYNSRRKSEKEKQNG